MEHEQWLFSESIKLDFENEISDNGLLNRYTDIFDWYDKRITENVGEYDKKYILEIKKDRKFLRDLILKYFTKEIYDKHDTSDSDFKFSADIIEWILPAVYELDKMSPDEDDYVSKFLQSLYYTHKEMVCSHYLKRITNILQQNQWLKKDFKENLENPPDMKTVKELVDLDTKWSEKHRNPEINPINVILEHVKGNQKLHQTVDIFVKTTMLQISQRPLPSLVPKKMSFIVVNVWESPFYFINFSRTGVGQMSVLDTIKLIRSRVMWAFILNYTQIDYLLGEGDYTTFCIHLFRTDSNYIFNIHHSLKDWISEITDNMKDIVFKFSNGGYMKKITDADLNSKKFLDIVDLFENTFPYMKFWFPWLKELNWLMTRDKFDALMRKYHLKKDSTLYEMPDELLKSIRDGCLEAKLAKITSGIKYIRF